MISDVEKFEIKEGKETLRFEIHKMDAVAGERWLFRAISLVGQGFNDDLGTKLSNGNIDIGGMIRALCQAPFEDAMNLMNELLPYAYRVIDAKTTQQLNIETVSGVIKSPITLIKLRLEIARYNFSFFQDLGVLASPGGRNTD